MSFAWSFTFLNDFENCARKAQHKYILKDLPKEKKSEQQTWGIEVHNGFDLRVRAKRSLPANMVQYEPLVLSLEQAAVGRTIESEKRMGINASGEPVEFFAQDVWGRGTADVVIHAQNVAGIWDWKTGKVREDPHELEVQALLLKARYPGLKAVKGAYVWLQENRVGKVHDLSNFAATWNGIKATMKTVEMMPTGQEWSANPNPLCGWCPVKTCEHNPLRG